MKKIELYNYGFNLIELIIALSMGLILMSGLNGLYLNLKSNYILSQAYSRIQENGRVISQMLLDRLRISGLASCESTENPVVYPMLTGFDSEHLPDELQGLVKEDTDAIVINSCNSNTGSASEIEFTSMAYFVGDSNRKNSQGREIYSLYQKPQDGDRVELVEGVDNLKIQYEIKSDNSTSNQYFLADSVSDWNKVIAVHMDLLLDSVEPITLKPQAYYFQMQKIIPEDRLLYQPWSLYAGLREPLKQ